MNINVEDKIVFLRNPKTASTSISSTLSKYKKFRVVANLPRYRKFKCNYHPTMEEVIYALNHNKYDSKLFEYIVVVRFPPDKMVSLYVFAKFDSNYNPSWSKNYIKDDPNKISFDKFIKLLGEGYFSNDYDWNTVLKPRKLEDFIYFNEDYKVTIYKYENMDMIEKRFKELIDSDLVIPFTNYTNHKKYHEYYNKELAEIVYNEYKYEIDNYYEQEWMIFYDKL